MTPDTTAAGDLTKASGRELKKLERQHEATLERLRGTDAAEVVREGLQQEVLDELRATAAGLSAVRVERGRRASGESGRSGPYHWFASRPDAQRRGLLERYGLDPARLSREELDELAELDRKVVTRSNRLDLSRLTDEEQARVRELWRKGESDDQRELRETREEATRERGLRDAVAAFARTVAAPTLPRRPKLEEPGAVTLPSALFRTVVRSTQGRPFTLADAAALWFFLAAFENASELPATMRLEADEAGDPVLIARASNSMILVGSIGQFANPRSEFEDHIRLPARLDRLARNGWLEVASRGTSETRIKLGPRALALRAGKKAGSQATPQASA